MNEYEELREFLSSGISRTVKFTLQGGEAVAGTLLSVKEKHLQIQTSQGRRLLRIEGVEEDSIIILDEAHLSGSTHTAVTPTLPQQDATKLITSPTETRYSLSPILPSTSKNGTSSQST